MCKKLFVATIAILVGLTVVKHTQLGSLMQVWWHDAQVSMEKQIPPEVQIKRLAVEISKIDADIKRNLSRLAGRTVDCKKLAEEVADLRTRQKELKGAISEMERVLDRHTERVVFQGDTYTVADLTYKLDNAVSMYTVRKAELKAKEQLLSEKRRTLEEATHRISTMSAQRDQLRVTVARLESQLEILKGRQMDKGVVDLDDSQVARCNELAAKIKADLERADEEAKLYAKYGYNVGSQYTDREPKSTDEVLRAARKALQEDEGDKVVGK